MAANASFLEIASQTRRIDSMEAGFSSSSEEPLPSQPPAFLTSKRLFAVGAGLLGLAGCAAAALHVSSAPAPAVARGPVDSVSARSLLEHPDFIDAAAENVWKQASEHLAGKEHKLRPAMRHVMSKVMSILNEHDPEGGRQLEAIKLSRQQKGDVVSMVRQMSDKRVQKVGQEVLEIGLKHQNDKESALEAVQRDISSTFQPRMEELRSLKSSVVPASIRDIEDQRSNAEVSVQQQRRLSSTTDCSGDTSKCHPGSVLTSAMGKHMGMKMEDALGIVGALLEQARLAMDESSVIGSSFGSKSHVPYYWRSLIGGAAFGVETMDCFMRQNDVHKTDKNGVSHVVDSQSKHYNSVKMSMCPMKYAGAGMDFLSGMNNAAGIQNTKLPQDFQTMFGGTGAAPAPHAGYSPVVAHPGYYPNAAQHAAANPFAMFAPPQPQPTAHPLAQMAHSVMKGAHDAMNNVMDQHAATPPAAQHPFAYQR